MEMDVMLMINRRLDNAHATLRDIDRSLRIDPPNLKMAAYLLRGLETETFPAIERLIREAELEGKEVKQS